MRERGFQLIQMLVVLAVLTLVSAVTLPPLLQWTSALRLRLAAAEFVGALRQARLEAIRSSQRVGIKFRPHEHGRVTYSLHRDGDGDGVRTADIASGVDPIVGLETQLMDVGAHVRLGFPPGVEPRDPGDPGRRLGRLDDPVRFNNSDIASFNTLGQSTPGTLYLTDGARGLAAVRLFAGTGRIRVLLYDVESERWRQD